MNLQSRLGTTKVLALWTSTEYIAFCQRQKYYQWLHTLADGEDVYDNKDNSRKTLHIHVNAMHGNHVKEVESRYGRDGWTLYPEEKEDE